MKILRLLSVLVECRVAEPPTAMSRPATHYRGKSSLHPQTVASIRVVARHKGGTRGKGTRPGKSRTPAEWVAHQWDATGFQLASLNASFLIYSDAPSRVSVCMADGQHPCGLQLVRPRRAACDPSTCVCRADTTAMARRLGVLDQAKARFGPQCLCVRVRYADPRR